MTLNLGVVAAVAKFIGDRTVALFLLAAILNIAFDSQNAAPCAILAAAFIIGEAIEKRGK